MPVNTVPIFTKTPKVGTCAVSVANTASDGSGSLATLFTAGEFGSRIERIRYSNAQVAPAASSAMVIRLFITDATGSNPTLLTEIPLSSVTRTTTSAGAGGTYTFANGLVIPAGTIIKVAQSVYAGVQDLMHFVAEGGDY